MTDDALLRDDCVALEQDFLGCDEQKVNRIKKTLLERLCAPEWRTATRVKLYQPCRLGDGVSLIVEALFERGDASVTMTTVVDEQGGLHVFPA